MAVQPSSNQMANKANTLSALELSAVFWYSDAESLFLFKSAQYHFSIAAQFHIPPASAGITLVPAKAACIAVCARQPITRLPVQRVSNNCLKPRSRFAISNRPSLQIRPTQAVRRCPRSTK
jgi:hypothetical protein